MRFPRPGITRIALLLALIVGGGSALTAGLVLPDDASDQARESTADVTPGSGAIFQQGGGGGFGAQSSITGDIHSSITGDINSAFGKCVSNQARTQLPNENHPGFNPTDACAGLRHDGGATSAGQGEGPDHPTGQDRAEERSGGNAGGGSQGPTQQGGTNPAGHPNQGADNAAAKGDNANH